MRTDIFDYEELIFNPDHQRRNVVNIDAATFSRLQFINTNHSFHGFQFQSRIL